MWQFIHEIFLIEESIRKFVDLSKGLYDQLDATRAEKEVAEELKAVMEQKLTQSATVNLSLEKVEGGPGKNSWARS